MLGRSFYSAFPEAKGKTLEKFGKTIGHAGASDAILGLDYLKKTNHLKSNNKVFLIGAGSGFTWTAILLEIV
jgi:3-oxoacyl-[acyl-carrier-protein] synthase-3